MDFLKVHVGYSVENEWEAKIERLDREQPITSWRRDDCDLKYGGCPGDERGGKMKRY